jgi:hypothetical protein
MGCGMSTEEKEGKARNEEIENQLKKDRMMQRNEIKMLLLGEWRLRDTNPPLCGRRSMANGISLLQVPVNLESRRSSSR